MKTLVATGFYYETSKNSGKRPTNAFRNNTACKNIEFFNLWHHHVRHFLPVADVLILDNGSPIPFSSVSLDIPEDVFQLNNDYKMRHKFNVVRHEGRLKHHNGWARQISTILYIALINNYDYLIYVEADALLGFDPEVYYGYDFVSLGEWGGNTNCSHYGVKQAFMMIEKKLLLKHAEALHEEYNRIKSEGLNIEKSGGSNHLYDIFNEIGFRERFWTGNSRFLSKDDLFLHDSNERDLNSFLNLTNI